MYITLYSLSRQTYMYLTQPQNGKLTNPYVTMAKAVATVFSLHVTGSYITLQSAGYVIAAFMAIFHRYITFILTQIRVA